MVAHRSKLLAVCGMITVVLQFCSMGAGCLAQSGAKNPAGNRELMNDWVQQKRNLKKKIVEELRSRHRLPKTGYVEFEARIKRNPARPDDYIVEIENFRAFNTTESRSGSAPIAAGSPVPDGTAGPSGSIPSHIRGTIELSGRGTITERFTFQEVLNGGAGKLDHQSIADLPVSSSAAVPSDDLKAGEGDSTSTDRGRVEDRETGVEKEQADAKEPKSWWRRLLGL